MYLLIDFGNSRIKAAFCTKSGELSEYSTFNHVINGPQNTIEDLKQLYKNDWPRIETILVSNVRPSLNGLLAENFSPCECHFLETRSEYAGLINGYYKPTQMGVDRWIGMIAARRAWANRSFILVDAGTAVTIDRVDSRGVHSGGYIIPGLAAQKNSLLGATERVFADEFDDDPSMSLGLTTVNCVRNGILTSVCALIDYSRQNIKDDEAPITVLTGGDSELLYYLLINELGVESKDIVQEPNLILKGIAELALNQHKKT